MILSLIPYQVFPPVTGGRKAIVAFTENIAAQTPLVAVTVRRNDPREAKGYLLYNILPDTPLRYINPFSFFTLRKLIKKHHITHLMLEHPYWGWLGILLKKLCGVKLVIRSHNIEAQRWKSLGKWWWPVLLRYEGLVHRAADMSFFIQPNDRAYAIDAYKVPPEKAETITYGIDRTTSPSVTERKQAAALIRSLHRIRDNETIFLFNGTLDYKPNTDAVRIIAEAINPLLQEMEISYRIIVCGGGLPAEIAQLDAWNQDQIIYAGFVPDIDVYFKGANVFINPVTDGGGIKTKLVEALGAGTKCVSTLNGSIGVQEKDAGGNLVVVPDGDWEAFAREMARSVAVPAMETPPAFYEKFYWGAIAEKAISILAIDHSPIKHDAW